MDGTSSTLTQLMAFNVRSLPAKCSIDSRTACKGPAKNLLLSHGPRFRMNYRDRGDIALQSGGLPLG